MKDLISIKKEIEDTWDNLIQKEDRFDFIKSLKETEVSLGDITLRKRGLDTDLWKEVDSTTNQNFNILNNCCSSAFSFYGTEDKLYLDFFDKNHLAWLNVLSFNKHGEIKYNLINTTIDFNTLKEYTDYARPINRTSNKEQTESKENCIEVPEDFLKFSKKYGQKVFDRFCKKANT